MRALGASRTSVVPGGALAGSWTRNALWKTARAVPSLDLRFADNKTLGDAVGGGSLVTFTRASSATFVGSDGLIKTAATNEARFDHNPTTGESLGLLVEEARTNLALRSEELDNASWSKTGSSVSANSTTGPDNSSTADKIVEDTSTGGHVIIQSVSALADSTTYTASIFCKAAERSWVALTIVDKAGGLNRVWVNLLTGAQGTTNGTVSRSSVVAYLNGWYLLSVSASTATGVGTPQVRLSMGSADNTASYTGNGTSGLFVWGAMLEAGAFPTSYIPTTTATVTRAADVASITGAAFSSFYNQTEGTVYADASGVNNISGATRRYLEIRDTAASDRLVLGYATTTSNRFLVIDGGATVADVSVASLPTAKAAGAYKVNSFQLASNGVLGTEDNVGVVPTPDQLQIGSQEGSTANTFVNGTIKRLTYWPTRLSNITLQQITQP